MMNDEYEDNHEAKGDLDIAAGVAGAAAAIVFTDDKRRLLSSA